MRWTRDQASDFGSLESALKAVQVAFRQGTTLTDCTAVQQVAGDQWPTIRPALLQPPHAVQHLLTSLLSEEDVSELGIRPLQQASRLIQYGQQIIQQRRLNDIPAGIETGL